MIGFKDLAFEDGVDIESWMPVVGFGSAWLAVKDNGMIVGVCKIRVMQASSLEFHPYISAKKCLQWQSIVKCMFRWFYENKKINKIISFIGVNHKTTYRAALRIGFKEEGLIEKSYLKNGKLLDQHIVGLTRERIGEII